MTIPANQIVQANPAVVSSGGSPLAINGMYMSKSTLLPVSAVQSFVSPSAVSDFFGPASAEYAQSLIYFLGFDNSTIKPGRIYFAPYVGTARAAWLQSGSFAGATLTDIQALSGTLIVTVDGTLRTSSSINLSAASSFTNAATLITAGFSGGPLVCTWNAVNSKFTLTSATTGAASTMTLATGTMATGMKFTSATGAVLSQGADVDTPGTAMDMVKSKTQNWVLFMTMWEPNLTDKELFAVWANAQNQRYGYIPWDTDAQAIVNGSTTCFGSIAKSLGYDTAFSVYNTIDLASFVLGTAGSIDFSQRNGRITVAFKSQSGFIPTVTDEQIGANLTANGYNFYGAYATANDQFNFLYNGQTSGKWKWLDTFINQVYLNSQFQLALLVGLTEAKSIPYNEDGYTFVRALMGDPIRAALNFGSIRPGVTLSLAQKAEVNQAAGSDVSGIIEQQGFYLQVLDPGAQVRGNRGTPVINFWYTDGGAIQHFSIASIDIM